MLLFCVPQRERNEQNSQYLSFTGLPLITREKGVNKLFSYAVQVYYIVTAAHTTELLKIKFCGSTFLSCGTLLN